MRQRLRYIRKNGEGKQRQQHKKGEWGACLCLRETIDLFKHSLGHQTTGLNKVN